MATNISNMLNTRLRMSGLASGLDTDTMIKQLMRVETMKVDKVRQDRQLLEWKRDNYREITNLMRGFRDSYFDVLKPQSNFRSPSAFAAYDIKSGDESIVTAKAAAGAASTTHEITVRKLATAATIEKTDPAYHVTSAVDGSIAVSDFNLYGKQFTIDFDGTKRTISLDDYVGVTNTDKMADMQAKLQAAIDGAIGAGKLQVAANGLNIEFKSALSGSTFTISDVPNNFISSLGLADGQKNYITGSALALPDLSAANGKINVSLGGTSKEIEITGLTAASTLEDLRLTLETALNNDTTGFGAGSFSVKLNGSQLEVVSNKGDKVVLSSAATSDVLGKLGFTSGANASVVSSAAVDLSTDERGKTFIVNVNGTNHEIEIDQNYSSLTDMAAYIKSQLVSKGVTTVDVAAADGKLKFSSTAGDKVEFRKGPEDSLLKLGFAAADNKSNRLSLTASLDSVEKYFAAPVDFNAASNVSFVINNVRIDLKKKFSEASIQDVMNAVNASSANVELKYDSLHDKFTLVSKKTGAAETISLTDTDPANGLFKALGIQIADLKAGEDAEFDLDGVLGMKRGTNEFSIDGVTYTLKDVPDPLKTVSISVNANADNLVTKIKEFVTKYNEVVDQINNEYSEKRDKNYLPLTDEQKQAMSEDDIKKWEEKTKEGLLKGDSILGKILTDMRKALYDPVEGASTNLYSIGITTGTYEQKGKLVIDEDKLKAAIQTNIDSVTQLFTKSSDITYEEALSNSGKHETRYEQSGLAQRLYDIIQDNIRTTRDTNGYKGILLEKAGITEDLSEFENTLSKDIDKKDILIDTLLSKLADKEDSLYKKFTAMETALSQMNSQSSWLAQQFGGGQ